MQLSRRVAFVARRFTLDGRGFGDGASTIANVKPDNVGVAIWIGVCLVLASAMLAGAAQAQLRAVPITVPDLLYELDGYSVLAPQGIGWFELKRDKQTVLFGKKIASRTHAVIATAMSTQITEKFEQPEDFLEYMSRMPFEADARRNRMIENRLELDASIGRFCVRLYARAIDRGAVNAEGRPLLLETYGVSCLHPADPTLVVSVSYSERGLLAETNAELRAQGESFVGSLKFTALKP